MVVYEDDPGSEFAYYDKYITNIREYKRNQEIAANLHTINEYNLGLILTNLRDALTLKLQMIQFL